MTGQLRISVGQHSDKGRKATQQDFHGLLVPREPQLSQKGIAIAMADGISSSDVGHIASETAVRSLLDDYYCTSDAWSVRHSVDQVVAATNAWLHAQTRKSRNPYERDRGYVCTLSALVLKGTTAHLFNAGDTRIYRLREQALEPLTRDHRRWVSREQSYLSRALGMEPDIELDYRSLPLDRGDVFLLATDGIYEHLDARCIIEALADNPEDLDQTARRLVVQALERGSPDNLSLQIVRIDALPQSAAGELQRRIRTLPFPPILEAGMCFDGYRIIRELHATSRSHVVLAEDEATGTRVAIKLPSIDLRSDPAYLERFLLEEWIARRIDSPHVLKAALPSRKRNYLYTVTEFIEGRTLAQWLTDHPRPDLETVRDIIEQIARGLRAFHRLEMLHQDLKPDNLMIDRDGTLRIIDFGSTRVAGIVETATTTDPAAVPGTALYSAPEYFLGEGGSPRSDLFSLGVIAYQLLSGRFPYGTDVAKSRTVAAQRRLRYRPVLDDEREIPAWVDDALRKAVHIQPYRRYETLSEFVFDLRHPNQAFLNRTRPPLIERNPVLFWQGLSLMLSIVILFLLYRTF